MELKINSAKPKLTDYLTEPEKLRIKGIEDQENLEMNENIEHLKNEALKNFNIKIFSFLRESMWSSKVLNINNQLSVDTVVEELTTMFSITNMNSKIIFIKNNEFQPKPKTGTVEKIMILDNLVFVAFN